MNTYVALLRGINVGGNKPLPMKDLTEILSTIGFEDIRTYIQSGNAVLRHKGTCAPNTARTIAAAIQAHAGFTPNVLLMQAAEFRRAVKNNPFDTTIGKALHLFFLESPPAQPDLAKLASIRSSTEQFALHGKVFYLLAPDGIGKSKLATAVERCMGTPATARNWTTVSKILELVERAR